MIRRPISATTRIALVVISVLALLIAYAGVCAWQKSRNPSDTTVPNLHQLIDGASRAFSPQTKVTRVQAPGRPEGEMLVRESRSFFSSWFWTDSAATWGRLFLGLGVGVGAGVLLGLLMGCYTPIEAMLQAPLDVFAKIPPTAMLAVFFVLFGTRGQLFVAMIAFGILPSLAQAVHLTAKKNVPQELIDKAHTLGASQLEIIWNIIFKQALPTVIEASRLCVGPAMVYLIAAEWLVADVGFGYRLRIQSRLLDMSVVYIYLAILAIAGYVIDLTLRQLVIRLCPWFHKQ